MSSITVFVLFYVRLTFKYTLTKSIVLLYPLIIEAAIFGNRNVFDYFYESWKNEQPQYKRYKSAQMEMKYILKNVIFNTLQAVYFIVFVPIYFSPSDSPVYVDYDRYELKVWFYLILNFLYYVTFYLDKRYFEMQFLSQVLGGWSKVYEPTGSETFKNKE